MAPRAREPITLSAIEKASLSMVPAALAGALAAAVALAVVLSISGPRQPVSLTHVAVVVAVAVLLSPSLAALRCWAGRIERQNLINEIDGLRKEFTDHRIHLKQLKFENHWLADISRQKNRQSAIECIVRHLAQGHPEGFVLALQFGSPSQAPLITTRGLSEASRRQLGMHQSVAAELCQGFLRLEGRALRQSALFQSLAPVDRRRIRQSIDVFTVAAESENPWGLATTGLPPITGSHAEKVQFVQLLCAAGSRQRASEHAVATAAEGTAANTRFHSPHAELKAIVGELRTFLGVDRVSLRLQGREGRIAELPVASSARPVPPGVDQIWRGHEAKLCERLLRGESTAWLRSADLQSLGMETLLHSAAGSPIRLRGTPVGALCCTSQGPWATSADVPFEVSAAARRIEQALERMLPVQNTAEPEAVPSTALSSVGKSAPVPHATDETVLDAQREHFASVTHELRTPMLGILGMTDLMLETNLEPRQRQYLAAVRSSSESLLHLVNDLLDMSKLDADGVEIESVPFELRPWIDETLLPLRCRADQKGISLALELDPAMAARWNGDPLRLRQVLNNLVGNAIKFTERGGVTVKFDEVRNASGPLLQCRVIDTGLGIPSDRLERIFKRYAQADAAVARRFGGTGLGLAISHRLVELMGGTLTAASEPGRGSEFTFSVEFAPLAPALTMPRETRKGMNDPSAPAVDSTPVDDGGLKNRIGRRVLLVEDHEINQALGVARLEAAGCRVTVARNGREAVQQFRPGDFDLVLMDLQMPVVDGLEAAAQIRRQEAGARARTPIFGMTASAGEAQRASCLAAGMDDCLPKPIDTREIERRLSWRRAVATETLTSEIPPHALPLARTFLPMFLDSSELLCEEIERSVSAGDARAIASAAHRLSGAAASMSIASISRAACELEQVALAGDLDGIDGLLAQIESSLRRIRAQAHSTPSTAVGSDRPEAHGTTHSFRSPHGTALEGRPASTTSSHLTTSRQPAVGV